MGIFMASLSFRCTDKEKWTKIKPVIREAVSNIDGIVDNLDTDGPGYGLLNLFGDESSVLAQLPEKISALTEDYAVFAVCVDSDFNLLSLYNNGKLLENSYIGHVYPEYREFCPLKKPAVKQWLPLLENPAKAFSLRRALYVHEVFAEDNLRRLSELTGLPILDDNMIEEYVNSHM